MAYVVSSTDPRSVKALALLPQARAWTHGTRKCDGRPFLIAPGSNGHSYYVDANGAECTCPDRQTRRVDVCKHMTAARLLLAERGEQPASQRPMTSDRAAAIVADRAARPVRPVGRVAYDALFPEED